MKKLVLSFLLGATVFYCNGQIVQSICTAPDSITEKYIDDADRLALRKTFRIGSSYRDSVTFSKSFSNVSQNALIAVYNAYSLPARDSVIRIFICIHFRILLCEDLLFGLIQL